jgi:hypothetical protein
VSTLIDSKIDTKLKLCALWASTMFCYIYCDYFELYVPGKLQEMLDGKMLPLGSVTDNVLIGTSLLMAVPSLMIFLSVALPARYNRIFNLVIGSLYTVLLTLLVVVSGWYFYKMFASIEAVLTALIVWHAWKWPKANDATAS